MPTGLPNAAALLQSMESKVFLAIEYLEIPPFHLVKEQFLIAYRDILQASRSSCIFLEVVSRPLLIIISVVSRYLFIILRVVAQHTIYHAILALKEAWRQLITASRWFIAYQKTLSTTTIYMEVAFIFMLIGLYAIRKYIQKKRYVERVTKWYQQKRANVVLKYNRVVDKVAQTSMILALLLPHLLYIFAMGTVKYFLPGVVRYFATKTLLCDLIKFYIPFARTISTLHQWRSFDLLSVVGSNSEDCAEQSKSAKSGYLSIIRKKRDEKVKKSDGRTNCNDDKSEEDCNVRPRNSRTRFTNEHRLVFEDALNLLKYWIVVGILTAMLQTMKLLPIFGRILSNISFKQNSSRLPWKQKRLSWLNRVKPSAEFFQEMSLLFFIWLRLLPTSFTGTQKGDSIDILQAKTMKSKSDGMAHISSCPVDILYNFLSPAVAAIVSSQNNLMETVGTKNKGESGSIIKRAAAWCTKFLDVMVWTKLIRESSRNKIISTLTECSDLIPAMVTLLMPGYFTSYGVIYVQLVVPVANSSKSIRALSRAKTNADMLNKMNSISRFLQYWIIEEVMSWILSSFYPILVWIPLSQHFVLLLFTYAQLQVTTQYLYNIMESELVAFGILHAHSFHNVGDFNDTVTMKVFNSVAKRISYSVPSQESCDRKSYAKESSKTDIEPHQQDLNSANSNKEKSKGSDDKRAKLDKLQKHADDEGCKEKSEVVDGDVDKRALLDELQKQADDDDYVAVE